jgi:hypothetical protein
VVVGAMASRAQATTVSLCPGCYVLQCGSVVVALRLVGVRAGHGDGSTTDSGAVLVLQLLTAAMSPAAGATQPVPPPAVQLSDEDVPFARVFNTADLAPPGAIRGHIFIAAAGCVCEASTGLLRTYAVLGWRMLPAAAVGTAAAPAPAAAPPAVTRLSLVRVDLDGPDIHTELIRDVVAVGGGGGDGDGSDSGNRSGSGRGWSSSNESDPVLLQVHLTDGPTMAAVVRTGGAGAPLRVLHSTKSAACRWRHGEVALRGGTVLMRPSRNTALLLAWHPVGGGGEGGGGGQEGGNSDRNSNSSSNSSNNNNNGAAAAGATSRALLNGG